MALNQIKELLLLAEAKKQVPDDQLSEFADGLKHVDDWLKTNFAKDFAKQPRPISYPVTLSNTGQLFGHVGITLLQNGKVNVEVEVTDKMHRFSSMADDYEWVNFITDKIEETDLVNFDRFVDQLEELDESSIHTSFADEFKSIVPMNLHKLHSSPEQLKQIKQRIKFPLKLESGCSYMGSEGTITITLKKSGEITVIVKPDSRGRSSDRFQFYVDGGDWAFDLIPDVENTLYA